MTEDELWLVEQATAMAAQWDEPVLVFPDHALPKLTHTDGAPQLVHHGYLTLQSRASKEEMKQAQRIVYPGKGTTETVQ